MPPPYARARTPQGHSLRWLRTRLPFLLNITCLCPLVSTHWYDSDHFYLQDYCVNTYGGTYAVANGALANMKLGQRHFLLEQNWANTSPAGSCRKAYP